MISHSSSRVVDDRRPLMKVFQLYGKRFISIFEIISGIFNIVGHNLWHNCACFHDTKIRSINVFHEDIKNI